MSPTLLRRIKLALAATLIAFLAIAASISYAVVERQAALHEVSRYNITWVASQALTELQRLENRVLGFRLGRVDADEVQLRFDVLHNRLSVLRGSELSAMTEADAELAALVDAFDITLKEMEPLIATLDRPGHADRLVALVDPLSPKLARLAGAAKQFSEQQLAADQSHLLKLHWAFTGIALGLVICGLVFIGLLFLQGRILQKAHDDLQAMADDLRRAKDVAEEANEAKSRFLATMSHELRTPLNAIIGFSEIIHSELLGPLQHPAYRDYAGDILTSGRHMFALVNDLLTTARLDAGHYDLSPEPLDLQETLETVVEMFGGTDLARGRDIVVEARDGWPPLTADERALRQMLLNLLSNAAKFSDPGTPIRLACRRTPAGETCLTVSDRGIGMMPEEAAIAVRPFQQVDSRLSRKYNGAGLGLSIVAGLMAQHGGRLEIESRPGQGADISLVFPPDDGHAAGTKPYLKHAA